MFRRCIRPIAGAGLALGVLLATALPLSAQAAADVDGAAAMGLALRRLGTTKRVLMIGAHPDDENTAVLSELALGDGADVAYLSLTRGEGGQNLIGPELEEPLGLIRTEELLAARRLDGAEQFFTRAYDFGFSKSADEALTQWPRDSLLADVVLVIRRYRPDIIVSVFSGTPRDGHGHHQAAGILAREAFGAAGDPARFPGQIAPGLRAHQPAALYQALYRGEPDGAVALETGELDPLLGRSRFQIAMASRSRHRSQDMGRAEPLGPQQTLIVRLDGGDPDVRSLFAAVDTMPSERAEAAGAAVDVVTALRAYEREVAAVRAAFNPFTTYALAPRLGTAIATLERAQAAVPDSSAFADLRFHIEDERDDAAEALRLAAGLVFDATVDDARVVPDQTFGMELTLWNGGTQEVRVSSLEPRLPDGWTATPLDDAPSVLAPASIATRRFTVRVSGEAQPTQPYFLRAPRQDEVYAWPADVSVRALPFEPPAVQAAAAVTVAGASLALDTEATFSDVDKAVGERRRPVLVVPALSVRVDPPLLIVPTTSAAAENGEADDAREVTVVVTSEAPDGLAATVRVEAPAGWSVEPATTAVQFAKPGDTRTLRFRVTPPSPVSAGSTELSVVAEAGGERYASGVQIVDYPHIRMRTLYHQAAVRLEAFDVAIAPNLRIGWIEGAGDDAARALRQLGAIVESLDGDALASADLSQYDAIVTGIRVYEVRPDLAAQNDRLIDYARRGGTVVVQYNKYEYPDGGFAPYPLTMARPHGRVTDENAAVRLLAPEHPAMSWPNRIGPRDFEGWVQERGLYFAETWDDRYVPLLEMADPGEPPQRGSLLVAPVGEGLYVYTGLALFRQIPEAVPGAYRLLANLVSMGKSPAR